MRFLLAQGTNINILDCYKNNALHHAVRRGNVQTVQFLIERGIDVHAKNDGNWNALHMAAASSFPHIEIVRMLIAAGINPNEKNDDGQTALDLAIAKREETSDGEEKKTRDAIIDELRSITAL
jgi:ankyrin repeat protein